MNFVHLAHGSMALLIQSSSGQQQQQFDHLGVSFIIPINTEWNIGQDCYLNLIWL